MTKESNGHMGVPQDSRNRKGIDVLLSWVRRGSRILWISAGGCVAKEFLVDELGCAVDSIELLGDKSVAPSASVWRERLATLEGCWYDYVVLYEALEYVANPAELLSCAERLLKEDGSLLACVPNAATNDAISNLYAGSGSFLRGRSGEALFLSLFGPRDLNPLFARAHLGIVGLVPITKGMLDIESAPASMVMPASLMIGEDVAQVLRCNSWGGVSSFVIKARRQNRLAGKDIVSLHERPLECAPMSANLFWAGEGQSFSPERRVPFSLQPGAPMEAEVDVSTLQATRVRIDPVEGAWCVVDGLSALADGVALEPVASNGVVTAEGFAFMTTDPMLVYEIPLGTATMRFTARVTLAWGPEGEYLVRHVAEEAERQAALAHRLEGRERKLEHERQVHAATVAAKDAQNKKQGGQIRRLKDEAERHKRNTSSIKWMIRHLVGLILRRLHLR